ncbi:anti-sigma factor family protein [Roseivirga misakiensis]|uniref:Zinc-finger domain-containing protein n=1 Tax=Roseivirga misakiensis TaxID=1563681 RepID=A0A1E5SYF6_9BACT|nr:hypothetical protein [Roseivirga misakiensis]OEK04164.1 hypothetical protein BFP71_11805 [Roseivirga misakiensis]
MNYKPTDEILIAYLYGELEEDQSLQVEAYLEANPEEKSRLKGLSDTRVLLNELDDEEIPGQLAFMAPPKNEEWLYWRKYAAIAATLLLIMTFGWLSGFKVNYDNDGFYMGYGEVQRGLSEEQVTSMINDNNLSISEFVENGLQANKDSLSLQLENLQTNVDNEALIREIFNNEKEALLTQMVGFNDKLSGDYREILREIVINFSNNIESQRIEDLRGIQAAFTDLEDATIGKQFRLEEALTDLEEKVNTVIANNSNNK